MAEGPDVVGGGAEVAAEPIAAAQVLVGCMDGLGPGVELGDPGDGPGVPLAGLLPDGAGLAVQVLASQADPARRSRRRCARGPCAGIGWSARCVGIPTLGRRRGARPDRSMRDGRRTGNPSRSIAAAWRCGLRLRLPRLRSRASVDQISSIASASRINWLNDLRRWRLNSRTADRRSASVASSRNTQGTLARPSSRGRPAGDAPRRSPSVPWTATRGDDQGIDDSLLADALDQAVGLCLGVAVNRYTEWLKVDQTDVD